MCVSKYSWRAKCHIIFFLQKILYLDSIDCQCNLQGETIVWVKLKKMESCFPTLIMTWYLRKDQKSFVCFLLKKSSSFSLTCEAFARIMLCTSVQITLVPKKYLVPLAMAQHINISIFLQKQKNYHSVPFFLQFEHMCAQDKPSRQISVKLRKIQLGNMVVAIINNLQLY